MDQANDNAKCHFARSNSQVLFVLRISMKFDMMNVKKLTLLFRYDRGRPIIRVRFSDILPIYRFANNNFIITPNDNTSVVLLGNGSINPFTRLIIHSPICNYTFKA